MGRQEGGGEDMRRQTTPGVVRHAARGAEGSMRRRRRPGMRSASEPSGIVNSSNPAARLAAAYAWRQSRMRGRCRNAVSQHASEATVVVAGRRAVVGVVAV